MLSQSFTTHIGETRCHWNVEWKILCSGQKSRHHLLLFLLLSYQLHPNYQLPLLAVLLKYIHHLSIFLHLFCCHPGPSLHNLTVETVIHSFLVGDQKTVLYERDGVGICHLTQNFGHGKFWTISKLKKKLSLIFQKFLFLLSHHCSPETYHGNAHLCLDLCCPMMTTWGYLNFN